MRSRWLSRRAIGLHVALGACLPTFAWLTDWQLHRALGGNSLSWAYTFEWPLFACYALFMWWRLLHEDGTPPEAADDDAPAGAPDPVDLELAAYNAYLAGLAAEDERRRREASAGRSPEGRRAQQP
ncbi:MAG TPA: hypothetical protein VKV23_00245 [Acidimicrobiales bacterium]|nr:hypothetical protein [Acidimicrobiales bacterium]